jgi:hypothetical protein
MMDRKTRSEDDATICHPKTDTSIEILRTGQIETASMVFTPGMVTESAPQEDSRNVPPCSSPFGPREGQNTPEDSEKRRASEKECSVTVHEKEESATDEGSWDAADRNKLQTNKSWPVASANTDTSWKHIAEASAYGLMVLAAAMFLGRI